MYLYLDRKKKKSRKQQYLPVSRYRIKHEKDRISTVEKSYKRTHNVETSVPMYVYIMSYIICPKKRRLCGRQTTKRATGATDAVGPIHYNMYP